MSTAHWIDGHSLDGHWTDRRALLFGDGVFRTCLVMSGRCRDVERQVEKLVEDARRLAIRPPDSGDIVQQVADALRAGRRDDGVLRIAVLRKGPGRGYRPHTDEAEVLISLFPMPNYPTTHWSHGVGVCRARQRLAAQPTLAGVKHLSRLENVLASREWPEGCEEAVMDDAQGRPVCGTRSNLFWVKNSVVRTVELDDCGVAGRMRERVMQVTYEIGLACWVAPASWSELADAQEVFLTNSLIGVWPVHTIEGRPLTSPGEVTRRIQQALDHPWAGYSG